MLIAYTDKLHVDVFVCECISDFKISKLQQRIHTISKSKASKSSFFFDLDAITFSILCMWQNVISSHHPDFVCEWLVVGQGLCGLCECQTTLWI